MKLWNYIFMITTMIIFLQIIGIPTGLGFILDKFNIDIDATNSQLINADLESSEFYDKLFGNSGWLVILIGSGLIIVGFFARSYDTSLVILPIVIFVGTLYASTFWTIIKYAMTFGQDWMIYLVLTILGPLGVGFLMSCVDYFGSRD